MKAKFVGTEFSVDLVDLARDMPPELLKEFAQLAVFQETLMEAVVDTVVTGCCFEGCWSIGGMAQRLREKLVPLLPEATQEFVKKLLEENHRLKSRSDMLQGVLSDLQRRWPANVDQPRESWAYQHGDYRYWNRAEVESFIKSKIPESEWEAFFAKSDECESEIP